MVAPSDSNKLTYTSPQFDLFEPNEAQGNLFGLIELPHPHLQIASAPLSDQRRTYTPMRILGETPDGYHSDDCEIPDGYYSDEDLSVRVRASDFQTVADRTESLFLITQGDFFRYLTSLPIMRQQEVRAFFREPQSLRDNPALIHALESLLLVAAEKDCPAIIRLILAHEEVDIHAQDERGNTALHKAVDRQSSGSIRALFLNGASDRIKNLSGMTPFDLAQVAERDEYLDILHELRKSQQSPSFEKLLSRSWD